MRVDMEKEMEQEEGMEEEEIREGEGPEKEDPGGCGGGLQ